MGKTRKIIYAGQGKRSKSQKESRQRMREMIPCPGCGMLISVLAKKHSTCGWDGIHRPCPECGKLINVDARQHSTCGWKLDPSNVTYYSGKPKV